jgi:hypothetical protein
MKKRKKTTSRFKDYWPLTAPKKKKSRNGKSPVKGKPKAAKPAVQPKEQKPMPDKKSDNAKSSGPADDPEAAKKEAYEKIRKIEEDATVKAYEEGVKQGNPPAKPASVAVAEAAEATKELSEKDEKKK